MLRGIRPSVDLAYLHKRDLRGNVLSYRRRKTGRALTLSSHPKPCRWSGWWRTGTPDSPICFPFCRARKVRKRHTGNTSRHSGDSTSGWQYSGKCLGMQSALSTYAARHTWATMAYHCEIHPGIISEAMGHSSITVTETYLKPFSNRKIDEANQRVISL